MSETLFHTKFLDLKSTPSKSGKPWVYAHRPNARDVVVILTCFNDEVLFIIEERPPIQAENKGKYTIGLVAGLVGDERIGENIEDAVKAELLEENVAFDNQIMQKILPRIQGSSESIKKMLDEIDLDKLIKDLHKEEEEAFELIEKRRI